MYTITSALYNVVAVRLAEHIGRNGYYSGSLELENDEVRCRLTVSVVVYHRRERMPEGESDVISDLVPVWWEFHTVTDGGEVLNDFSFGELRKYFNR